MTNVLRRLAPVLITAGLVLISLGGSQQIRPVSDQPAPRVRCCITRLDPVESKYTELHQMLAAFDVCVESGQSDATVWTQWPCSQWAHVPR